jgi:hypothetical protein
MIIKVNRARLIQAIASKRRKVVDAHFEARKGYASAFKAYRFDIIKKLAQFERVVQAATTVEAITPFLKYGECLRLPDAPKEPSDSAKTAEYDAALAKLALSDEEVIQLNEKSDRTFLDLLG